MYGDIYGRPDNRAAEQACTLGATPECIKIQEFRTTGLTVIGSRVVNSLSLGYSVLVRWTFADDVGMMWKTSGDPACWTWARLTSRSPT